MFCYLDLSIINDWKFLYLMQMFSRAWQGFVNSYHLGLAWNCFLIPFHSHIIKGLYEIRLYFSLPYYIGTISKKIVLSFLGHGQVLFMGKIWSIYFTLNFFIGCLYFWIGFDKGIMWWWSEKLIINYYWILQLK